MEAQEPHIADDWLLTTSQVQEQPFSSETAVIGGLMARFREAWNSISTKWYVRPLLQQQNEFNRLVVELVREHDKWLIAQDREQTALIHDLGELATQLIQMNRLLQSIDARLARLESAKEA